jgi:hypothetical protein
MERAMKKNAFADDHEPATEAMGVLEGITTAGAPATLSLQHLHSLRTTLAPLRAAYASAAVDRLRGLPTESRRAVLPHVLREHPDLIHEPRIRALADELFLDTDAAADRPDIVRWLSRVSGVRVESASDALARMELALTSLASSVAELTRWRTELLQSIGHHEAIDDLPEDAADVLAWALEAHPRRATPDVLARHAAAAIDAAREVVETPAEELAAIERRANVPRWWPSPFREAALWSRALTEARARKERSKSAWTSAFAKAFLARIEDERG